MMAQAMAPAFGMPCSDLSLEKRSSEVDAEMRKVLHILSAESAPC